MCNVTDNSTYEILCSTVKAAGISAKLLNSHYNLTSLLLLISIFLLSCGWRSKFMSSLREIIPWKLLSCLTKEKNTRLECNALDLELLDLLGNNVIEHSILNGNHYW